MKVSVAMTVYQGEQFLREQIDSVLGQLEPEDELVISLDRSEDASGRIIEEYQKKDARVKLLEGPGKGLMANFENAISHCGGDIIFLSDQDDIWEAGKVKRCKACFEDREILAVVHDAVVFNSTTEQVLCPSFFEYKGCGSGVLKNIIKNSYMGCCMVIRRELLQWILPFPEKIPMHDQWIGLQSELHGKTCFLPEKLIRYRRHSGNMTQLRHAGVVQMVQWRAQIVWQLVKRNLIVQKGKI